MNAWSLLSFCSAVGGKSQPVESFEVVSRQCHKYRGGSGMVVTVRKGELGSHVVEVTLTLLSAFGKPVAVGSAPNVYAALCEIK